MKNVVRAMIGALFTYVITPILVAVFTKGVDPTSLAGRILNAIYPPQVSERVTQPTPTPTPAPRPSTTMAPVVTTPPQPGATALPAPASLTRSPQDAPIAAGIAGPITVDGADFRVPLLLTASSDDLPVFATGGYNLEGWSATVQPGNAACSINIVGLNGLTSSQVDRWTHDQGRMTRLPAHAPVMVSAGFHCDRSIAPASTVSFTLTLGYGLGDQAKTVRFFANALPLAGPGRG